MTAPSHAVLWLDPGKMTGLACWVPGHGLVFARECLFMEAAETIRANCQYHRAGLAVGWEHFHVHPRTPPIDAHHAIEMIGVARYWATAMRCRILTPAQPAERKLASREMLEAIGWWPAGKDDAQSAVQHLLAWMLRSGNVPDQEQIILSTLRSRSGS